MRWKSGHDAAAAAHTDRVVVLADGRIRDDLASPTQEALQHAARTTPARRPR